MTGRVMLRVSVVSVALVALAASGCGGGSHSVAQPRKASVRHCAAGSLKAAGSSRVAWAAAALHATTAYRLPGGAAIRRFGRQNVNGATTVFGVLGKTVDARCRVAWLHVALPIRPNGITGWVRAADVQTAAGANADHGRPLGAPPAALQEREARAELHRRHRLERYADAARPLLREPAADPG